MTSIQRRSAVLSPVFAGLALNTGWPAAKTASVSETVILEADFASLGLNTAGGVAAIRDCEGKYRFG
ncbi:hypothetical protein HMPREF1628_06665 [Actinomyces sp. S4-C9]|nr:hypothetical protein HMPREF1628_06665 [Actinomyces sp. S4-C9]